MWQFNGLNIGFINFYRLNFDNAENLWWGYQETYENSQNEQLNKIKKEIKELTDLDTSNDKIEIQWMLNETFKNFLKDNPDIVIALYDNVDKINAKDENIQVKAKLIEFLNPLVIDILKNETISPIENVESMPQISEKDLIEKAKNFFKWKIEENTWTLDKKLCGSVIIHQEQTRNNIKTALENKNNVYSDEEIKWICAAVQEQLNRLNQNINVNKDNLKNIIDEYCKQWDEEHQRGNNSLIYSYEDKITWNNIGKAIENNNEDKLRTYLYKLFSDRKDLYKEFSKTLNTNWNWFILWVEDRWSRWWNVKGGWGIHMWVDYNLPVGIKVKSICEWKVIVKRSWTKVNLSNDLNDDQIKAINWYFEKIYWKDWWKTDNMLIIEHHIKWKTFYSLYLHITDSSLGVDSKVKKWKKIWKIAKYKKNGNRHPHLHFTIMKDLNSLPMFSWYLNKLTVNNDEQDENYQELFDEKYGKDMINPMDVYN